MLPEQNEWQVLRAQFTDTAAEEQEYDLALDEAYISFLDQSVLKGDGEDHKRMLLMNFDVPAHRQLLRELIQEEQFATSRVIRWYLDEYTRLFPGR